MACDTLHFSLHVHSKIERSLKALETKCTFDTAVPCQTEEGEPSTEQNGDSGEETDSPEKTDPPLVEKETPEEKVLKRYNALVTKIESLALKSEDEE